MTTRRELAELILESERTGRALQRRSIGKGPWVQSLDGLYNISSYDYRLEPKVVKHERWVILHDLIGYSDEESARLVAGNTEVMKIAWEIEE